MASQNFTPRGAAASPKWLEQVRAGLRVAHYERRTEESYVDWIKRYVLFHAKRHPQTMGAEEVREFLTDLAVRKKVAASTQNQALSAVLYLYRVVLEGKFPWVDGCARVQRPPQVPLVITNGASPGDPEACRLRRADATSA